MVVEERITRDVSKDDVRSVMMSLPNGIYASPHQVVQLLGIVDDRTPRYKTLSQKVSNYIAELYDSGELKSEMVQNEIGSTRCYRPKSE